MDLEDPFPDARRKYWENRLQNNCATCLRDLRKSVFGQDTNIFYRNENCGHQRCSNCYLQCSLPGTITKTECCLSGSQSTFERREQSSKDDDMKLYWNEATTAIHKFSESFKNENKALLEQNAELVKKAETVEREKVELNAIVEKKDREQSELKEEISILTMKLDAVNKEEGNSLQMTDTHCAECGYAVVFEKSRICIPCGIQKGLIIKQNEGEGNEEIQIISFDKAEISLLCGSCILEGAHEDHQTINYFKLKASRLSASHINEMTLRLNNTFDEGWDTVCQNMNQSHLPIVEILTKRDEKKMKQDSWEEFRKTQLKENSIVQRMTESKTNMVGHMHKYTGDMKALLMEAQTVLQAAQQSRKRAHSASGVEE